MSQIVKKTGSSRQKRTQRNRGSTSRSQKTGDFGTKISPPTNPPDTTAQPWWPVIITTIRRPGDYTITHLFEDFQSQLNSNKYTFNSNSFDSDTGTPFRAQFRFLGVNAWNLTGRILSLTVWEIPEQTYTESPSKFEEKDQLGSWVDCGGASAFPAIGYRYPSSHHRRIYRPDPRYKDKKIVSTLAASSDKVLLHLHINFKSDGPPKFNPVEQSCLPILRQIKDANTNLVKINESIRDSQGSTGNAIVKGAEVTAHYVLPLLGGEAYSTGSPADVASAIVQRDSETDLVSALLTRLSLVEDTISKLRESTRPVCEAQLSVPAESVCEAQLSVPAEECTPPSSTRLSYNSSTVPSECEVVDILPEEDDC